MGIAARTLAENDQNDEAKEMCRRVIQCGSYDAALGVIRGICEYCIHR